MNWPGAFSSASTSASCTGVRSCSSSMTTKSYTGGCFSAIWRRHSCATRLLSCSPPSEPGAVALEQAVRQLALRGAQQALPRAEPQVVGQRQRAWGLRADDAAEFLEQRLRIQLTQQPQGLAMAFAPGGEHRQRHFAAGRHAQRFQQLSVAEEVDLLLRVLEAQRRVQCARALSEVGRQRDVERGSRSLPAPGTPSRGRPLRLAGRCVRTAAAAGWRSPAWPGSRARR